MKRELLEYVYSILLKYGEAADVEIKKCSKREKEFIIKINNNSQIMIKDDLTSLDERLKKKVKEGIETQLRKDSFKSSYIVTMNPNYYLSEVKKAETVDTVCIHTITANAFTCYATLKAIDIFEKANHGKLTVKKDVIDSIPKDEMDQINAINKNNDAVANSVVTNNNTNPIQYVQRIGGYKSSRRIGSEAPDFSFDDLNTKIRVFVLDTGIALRSDLKINRRVSHNFITNERDDDCVDRNGHGTHVAGTIGCLYNNAAVPAGIAHLVTNGAASSDRGLLQATLSVADARRYSVGDFVEIALFQPPANNTAAGSSVRIVSINGNVLTIDKAVVGPIQTLGTINRAAQASSGIAPNIELIAYKVIRDNGTTNRRYIFNALERIGQYKKKYPDDICIVNMSIGGRNTFDDYGQRVQNLIDMGVIFVVSAGNSSEDVVNVVPAGIQSVITVGAYNSANNQFANFSNRGRLDIVAPGVSINNAWWNPPNTFRSISGTSMAAPVVTGAVVNMVAVALRNGKVLNQEEVKQRLIEDARKSNLQSLNPFISETPVDTTNLSLYIGEYPIIVGNY
jgi:subtilisin family serine protease